MYINIQTRALTELHIHMRIYALLKPPLTNVQDILQSEMSTVSFIHSTPIASLSRQQDRSHHSCLNVDMFEFKLIMSILIINLKLMDPERRIFHNAHFFFKLIPYNILCSDENINACIRFRPVLTSSYEMNAYPICTLQK